MAKQDNKTKEDQKILVFNARKGVLGTSMPEREVKEGERVDVIPIIELRLFAGLNLISSKLFDNFTERHQLIGRDVRNEALVRVGTPEEAAKKSSQRELLRMVVNSGERDALEALLDAEPSESVCEAIEDELKALAIKENEDPGEELQRRRMKRKRAL